MKRIALRALKRLSVRRVPAARALKKAELSIVITGNKGIRALNKKWRKKNKPTDVLSFPHYSEQELLDLGIRAHHGNIEPWSLGDVILNIDMVKVQAREQGVNIKSEIERLLVHGLVHLLGYDHVLGLKEARRMKRVERYLLAP